MELNLFTLVENHEYDKIYSKITRNRGARLELRVREGRFNYLMVWFQKSKFSIRKKWKFQDSV